MVKSTKDLLNGLKPCGVNLVPLTNPSFDKLVEYAKQDYHINTGNFAKDCIFTKLLKAF